jgi:hypothetical protein
MALTSLSVYVSAAQSSKQDPSRDDQNPDGYGCRQHPRDYGNAFEFGDPNK